jgi:hypothetical protein
MERTICLLSAESKPTKAVLTQTYMGVFFIFTVSDTIFGMLFHPVDQFEKHRFLLTCALKLNMKIEVMYVCEVGDSSSRKIGKQYRLSYSTMFAIFKENKL